MDLKERTVPLLELQGTYGGIRERGSDQNDKRVFRLVLGEGIY
jgi:hypothetical protein